MPPPVLDRIDRKVLLKAAAIAGGLWLVLLPWWRNHAILIDFVDYGLVVAAVGRIGAGERPHVDFSTPIQSLEFLVGCGSEKLFGASYLGLTWGNAVLTVVGWGGLLWLLRRRFSSWLAWSVATAVVIGSVGQHTIPWYNAMGVMLLAAVVWISATDRGEPRSWGRIVVWCGALWLGGMNKITFQVAALAFATVLAVRAAMLGQLTWRHMRRRIWAIGVFGIVAPIATELWFSGASFDQWLQEVVLTPARYRAGMSGQLLSPRFYLHTPHDYYHPLYLTAVGAAGLVLLIFVLVALVQAQRGAEEKGRRAVTLGFLLVLGFGTWISGSVLLATNMDIAYVSAAAWLVLVVGIVLAHPMLTAARCNRIGSAALGVASLGLAGLAWQSAWQGTRALWGHELLDRSKLVSSETLPAGFDYLRGVRVLASFQDSMRVLMEARTRLAHLGVAAGDYYFVHGTDWMVRVMPEAVHRGWPLWLASGTTYADDSAAEIGERLNRDTKIKVVVSYDGWDFWLPEVRTVLEREFERERHGARLVLYRRRAALNPLEAVINTQSNLDFGQIRVTGAPVRLLRTQNGLFFIGSDRAAEVDFEGGYYRFSGQMIAELAPEQSRDFKAQLRVYAHDEHGMDLLAEETLTVSPSERAMTKTFDVSPGGRAISLVVLAPPDAAASFGWRGLKTEQTVPPSEGLPRSSLPGLSAPVPSAAWSNALLAEGEPPLRLAVGYAKRLEPLGGRELAASVPSEVWLRPEKGRIHLRGEFALRGGSQDASAGVRVCVVARRAGRFEVMMRRDFPSAELAGAASWMPFEAWLPEGDGWFGLIVQPLVRDELVATQVVWRGLRTW